MKSSAAAEYWSANIKLVLGCLVIWFTVSYGCGIFFAKQLNSIRILGGYPLGFWFAQQGSIYTFVGLIFFYASRMNKLDQKFNVDDN